MLEDASQDLVGDVAIVAGADARDGVAEAVTRAVSGALRARGMPNSAVSNTAWMMQRVNVGDWPVMLGGRCVTSAYSQAGP